MDIPATSLSIPVYEFIAHQLKQLGIQKVFGLMSEDTAQLVAVLDAIGIRFYSARHENTAIGMAEGHASSTGQLSVALIGRGPATANGLHAATYASRTGSRVLLLIGDAPLGRKPNGTGPDTKEFKSIDVLRAAGLSVFSPTSPAAMQMCLADAASHANRGTTAILLLPVDIQKANVKVDTLDIQIDSARSDKASTSPRESALNAAAELLSRAERPLILAGKGAWLAGAKQALEALSDRTGAILCTSLKAKDMFAEHPFHVGLAGSFSFSVGRRFYEQADCIIAFGAGLNQRTTSYGKSFPSNVPVIQVDSNRDHIGKWFDADVAIVGDAREVAEQLLGRLPEPGARERGFHTAANRHLIASFDRASDFTVARTAQTMDPRALGIELNRIMLKERRVAYDAGNFLGILPYIDVPSPRCLKNSSEFGSIGLGFSTAMGFAEGSRGIPTYLFIGDGGLLMTLGELDTVAREGIPLVIFVMNDCAYGAETHFLQQHDMPVAKSIFADIDFADVAAHFGIDTATVRSISDLAAIADSIANPEGPILIDCKINGRVAAAFTAEHP